MDKITKIQETRKQMKRDIYRTIYDQFFRKIVAAVENSQSQVFLVVPIFVVGYPLFDRVKAGVYLKRQLDRTGKFGNVMQVGEYELYVNLVATSTPRTVSKNKQPSAAYSDYEFPTLVNLKKTANKLR